MPPHKAALRTTEVKPVTHLASCRHRAARDDHTCDSATAVCVHVWGEGAGHPRDAQLGQKSPRGFRPPAPRVRRGESPGGTPR
jgi:hypothetical protein